MISAIIFCLIVIIIKIITSLVAASAYTRTMSSVPDGLTNALPSWYLLTRFLISSCSPSGVTQILSASLVVINVLS